jgi:hypothetical protein
MSTVIGFSDAPASDRCPDTEPCPPPFADRAFPSCYETDPPTLVRGTRVVVVSRDWILGPTEPPRG